MQSSRTVEHFVPTRDTSPSTRATVAALREVKGPRSQATILGEAFGPVLDPSLSTSVHALLEGGPEARLHLEGITAFK
eukprot:136457-Alexandrium_andersonii.AAC.2